MATAKIYYQHSLKTNATHLNSGEVITTDAPKDNNGDGAYFSPTDLAATSLVSCMLTVMGIYANQNKLELGSISCEMTKIMASNPRRIAEIKIDADWKTDLNEASINKLKEIGLNCPVAKSLHPDIKQTINFDISTLS
jgi:putative redox protein